MLARAALCPGRPDKPAPLAMANIKVIVKGVSRRATPAQQAGHALQRFVIAALTVA
jgi:hypothetical protein